MNVRASFALLIPIVILGCASSQPNTDAPAPTVSVAEPPPPTASASTDAPPADTAKPEDTAKPADTTATPSDPPAGAGRLAFTNCSEESRKVKGCTKDLKPVCGVVDTGIRCIKAPCPSTAQKTFSNACSACLEPKATGFWPIACEQMSQPNPF